MAEGGQQSRYSVLANRWLASSLTQRLSEQMFHLNSETLSREEAVRLQKGQRGNDGLLYPFHLFFFKLGGYSGPESTC